MIHKIKTKIENIIKNPKLLLDYLLPILITIILIIPVPYYVTIGGGALNVDKKIKIENSYEEEGSFNLAYVSEVKGNVLFYLLAKIIPGYELEKIEDITIEEENIEDYKFREKLYFRNSLSSATKVAYTHANKNIYLKENNLYVIYVDKNAKTNLLVGDKILKFDNLKIESTEDLSNILNNYSIDNEIKITVLRDDELVETTSKIIEIDKEKKLGIYLLDNKIYNTTPKIEFNFTEKESGPSGGLTVALNIYNKLVKEDITKGYKIVGTGTIDEEGNVGEIGGVKYKLKGAIKAKADIFIVPKENYKEAKKIIKEKGYKIKLIGVSTFEETLKELNKL